MPESFRKLQSIRDNSLVTMMLSVSVCLLAIAITGSDAIQCYLCLGNEQSDCARDVTTSMAVLTCPDHIPHMPTPPTRPHPQAQFHHYNHHPHHHFGHNMFAKNVHSSLNDVDNNIEENKPMHPKASANNYDLYRNEMDSRRPVYAPPPPPPPMETLNAYCVQLHAKINQTSFMMNGCGYAPEGQAACTYIMDQNKAISSCMACNSDKCN